MRRCKHVDAQYLIDSPEEAAKVIAGVDGPKDTKDNKR